MVFVCKKSIFRISDWVTGQNWLRSKRVIFVTRGIRRLLTCLTLGIKSGGRTLGFSHCSSFNNTIHNFNSTTDIDPSLHPSFAASLRRICPAKNNAKKAGVAMDPSSYNTYYKLILQHKVLFSSDNALLNSPKTRSLVSKFASSNVAFSKAFVKSMVKMSCITGGGQEIRKNCRVVN
ncbi:putative peroxidase [Helianthus anomalus]